MRAFEVYWFRSTATRQARTWAGFARTENTRLRSLPTRAKERAPCVANLFISEPWKASLPLHPTACRTSMSPRGVFTWRGASHSSQTVLFSTMTSPSHQWIKTLCRTKGKVFEWAECAKRREGFGVTQAVAYIDIAHNCRNHLWYQLFSVACHYTPADVRSFSEEKRQSQPCPLHVFGWAECWLAQFRVVLLLEVLQL